LLLHVVPDNTETCPDAKILLGRFVNNDEKEGSSGRDEFVLSCIASAAAFVPQPALRAGSRVALSKMASPKMMDVSVVEQVSSTMAGVVAVDGGTIGLEVSFGAFLAVILGLFIPVVFLVTLFIQSDAQGTATTFRQPDSIGGTRFEDE